MLYGLGSVEKRNMNPAKEHESVYVEDNTLRLSPMCCFGGGGELESGRTQVQVPSLP